MATSINGWPAPPAKLKTFQVPGTKRRMTLDSDAGPVLVALAADYHKLIRPIDKGTVDDGGYNYRPARNASSRLSNHASGTAVDLNWSQEGAQGSGWGRKFFATARARAGIAVLKRRYGAVLQWGGDWRAKDYMHWEVKPGVTRARLEAFRKAAGIDRDGRRA